MRNKENIKEILLARHVVAIAQVETLVAIAEQLEALNERLDALLLENQERAKEKGG